MPLLAFGATHLLVFAVLAATAWVAGRTVLGDWEPGEGWERLAVPSALGLTILAHLLLALGFCGLLTRGAVLLLLVGVHGLGHRAWREAWSFARRLRGAITAGLLVLFLPWFVLTLYPPTAFDETLYHLPYARAFARSAGVPFLPDLRSPVFPQLQELLHTAVLLLSGDVATHLVQLLAVILTAALLAAWGRRAGGAAAGWLAAGMFLGNPIVVHLAVTGYVEAGLTLFATAAVYSLVRWREADGSESRRWLVLAAVFAGSAGGIKYLGLFFAGVVFLAVLWAAARERRWRDLVLSSLVMAAVLAPWYGRILYYTGNPVFPFFPDLMPGPPGPWDSGGMSIPRSPEVRLVSFLRLPWDVVFHRSAVGSQPPYSPVFFLGIPLLAVAAVRETRVRWLLAPVAVYAVIFSTLLPPDGRYLMAVLPLLSLALALAVAARVSRQLAAALAVVVLLPGWLYSGYRIWLQGSVPVSPPAREEYLARQLPIFPAIRYLNHVRGDGYTVYAFNAESMLYHADGRFLGDWNGPARYARLVPHLQDPPALWKELRRIGADHFLVARDTGVHLPVRDPVFQKLFRRVYSDAAADVYELARSPAAPRPSSIRPM